MRERERDRKVSRRELWGQGWASVPVEAIRWSWCLNEEGGSKRERVKDRGRKRLK